MKDNICRAGMGDHTPLPLPPPCPTSGLPLLLYVHHLLVQTQINHSLADKIINIPHKCKRYLN